MKPSIKCRCMRDKEWQVGTTTHFILDMKILIHNSPHYPCKYCKSLSFGLEVEDVELLLRIAYRLKIKELDFNDRNNELNVVFNISVEEVMEEDILFIINQNEIRDEETFAIMFGSWIIVGQRVTNFIVIEQLIKKIL